ncbi:MAG: hypothetical protein J5762_02170 [Clostridia bacterium]|nr:hypothetical protein [Clostridia bacterium]
MFYGKYYHQIDAKFRMRMPAAYKSAFNGKYSFRSDGDGVLSVYPTDQLDERYSFVKSLSPFDKKASELISRYLSAFFDAEEDTHGRIMIPKELRNAAGIKKDIVIYSGGDHVNITSLENYDKLNGDGAAALSEEEMEQLDEIYKKYVQ